MRHRNRTGWRKTIAYGLGATAFALACITTVAAAQEPPPVDDSGAKEALMAGRGRVTFRAFCASCHGVSAQGDGVVAPHLTPPPADLTEISARNGGEFPAEMVYKVIEGSEVVKGHGSKDMPVWGDIFRNPLSSSSIEPDEDGAARAERKINELVEYLRTIQGDDA